MNTRRLGKSLCQGGAPHLFQDIVVGEYLAGIAGQKHQKLVLDGSQMNLVVAPHDNLGIEVDGEIAIAIRLPRLFLGLVEGDATQRHAHSGKQLRN